MTASGRRDLVEKGILDGIHVLIAEDHDDTRELLEITLSHAAARVSSAYDGAAALDAVGRLVPDILLADLAMPTRDGFWLIQQVRGLPREKGGAIPAIAVSAMVTAQDVERAKALGYSAHVPKPADPEELARLIVRLVGRESPGPDPSEGGSAGG